MAPTSFPDPTLSAHRHAVIAHHHAIAFPIPFVTAVIVALRLWTRRTKSAIGLGLDDWFILAALTGFFGHLVNMIYMIKNGLGIHISELPLDEIIDFMKTIFAVELLYVGILGLIKLSVLIMYHRIFQHSTSIRITTWVLGSIVVVWVMACYIITIVQCLPVEHFWDPRVPGHCIKNTRSMFIANAAGNIGTDVAILLTPVFHIWTREDLQLTKRMPLTLVFSVGCFVVFASVYRFIMVLQIELSTGITCACLPCLRPLLTSFLSKIRSNEETPGSNKNVARLRTWRSKTKTEASRVPNPNATKIHEANENAEEEQSIQSLEMTEKADSITKAQAMTGV